MKLKDATLLRSWGRDCPAFVLLARLVMDRWSLFNGLIPVLSFLVSLVHVFAGVSLAVFFCVFYQREA